MGDLLQFSRADRSALRKRLKAALAAAGSVDETLEGAGASAADWRAEARAAARELRRPVQTVEYDGRLHASLKDWPTGPVEERIHQESLRRAVNSIKLPGPKQ